MRLRRDDVDRLVAEESGMTMGLTVIMIVLVGVMGAGLLTFVQGDMGSLANDNQGERAFEMAAAGAQAAKTQLTTQGGGNPESYNGGATPDLRWSKCFGLTSAPPCPPSSGAGFTLTNLDGSSATNDSAHVTIEYNGVVSGQDTFVAVSTGAYGDARRKIETVFKRNAAIAGIPPAYLTRNNLKLGGNVTSSGLSYLALKDADMGGKSLDFGTRDDVMKKWALTSDSGSFPNDFNYTPRGKTLPGIGALGVITAGSTGTEAALERGVRSFDTNTTPKTVPYYSASTITDPNKKIAFPFNIDALPNDIEILRQEAIRQEAASGRDHYVDALPVGAYAINSWPTDSTYNSVYFYRYSSWNTNNDVQWNLSLACTDETRKGVIVVENGNFVQGGSKGGFNGTVLVYGGTDPLTGQPYADRGQFKASGSACMTGYATSTGDMTLTGNYRAGPTPALTDLKLSGGAVRQVSWRELYQ